MERLGISGYSVGSCMVGPTNYLEQVVPSWGNSSPNKKAKGKKHQIEFLGTNSGPHMIGGNNGACGWSGSSLVHKELAQPKCQALLTF